MPDTKFHGFWSYVHSDDEHENGRIRRMCDRLQSDIQFHLGKPFKIFLDRTGIGWGQNWEERIADSLDDSLLLFPIVTPSYFSSQACAEELRAFHRRQEALGRNDLILPIYYLSADAIDSKTPIEDQHEAEIANILRAHQYEDVRSLRSSEETDPSFKQAIERLSTRALAPLKRSRKLNESVSTTAHEKESERSTSDAAIPDDGGASTENSLPGMIVTISVNQMPGRGDVTSISAAIARAPGGARIVVSPGHYREQLSIEKPLELIGNGDTEDLVIEWDQGDTIIFDTNIGLIRNFTIRQTKRRAENEQAQDAVWIKQGRLELEDCRITSTHGSCIRVGYTADPRIRRNVIFDSNGSGITLTDGARGTYEDNAISRSKYSGIAVGGSSNGTFRRNRCSESAQNGLIVYDDASGTFDDNEFIGNTMNGVRLRGAARPILRRSTIQSNSLFGVRITGTSDGTFEDNGISRNDHSGVRIEEQGRAILRRNLINSNGYDAIWMTETSRAVASANDLTRNEMGCLDIAQTAHFDDQGNTKE